MTYVVVEDFPLCDQVLDMAFMLKAAPERFGDIYDTANLHTCFPLEKRLRH